MGIKYGDLIKVCLSVVPDDPRLAWYMLLVAARESGGGTSAGNWGKTVTQADGSQKWVAVEPASSSKNLGAITGKGTAGSFEWKDSRPGPSGPVTYTTNFAAYATWEDSVRALAKQLRKLGTLRGLSVGTLLAATAGQYRDGYYTGNDFHSKWKNIAHYYIGHHRNATNLRGHCPPGGWLELNPSSTVSQAEVQAAWNQMMGGEVAIAPGATPLGQAQPHSAGKVRPAVSNPQAPQPLSTLVSPITAAANRPSSANGTTRAVDGAYPLLDAITRTRLAALPLVSGRWGRVTLPPGDPKGRALRNAFSEGLPLLLTDASGAALRISDALGQWHGLDALTVPYGSSSGAGDLIEEGDPLLDSLPPAWMIGTGSAPPAEPTLPVVPAPAPPARPPEGVPIPVPTPVPLDPTPQAQLPDPPPVGQILTQLPSEDVPTTTTSGPPPEKPVATPPPVWTGEAVTADEWRRIMARSAQGAGSGWLQSIADNIDPWIRLGRALSGLEKNYFQVSAKGNTFYGTHSLNARYDKERRRDLRLAGLDPATYPEGAAGSALVSWPRQAHFAIVHLRWFELFGTSHWTSTGGPWNVKATSQVGANLLVLADQISRGYGRPNGEVLLRAFWAGSSAAGMEKAMQAALDAGPSASILMGFPGPRGEGIASGEL